MEIPFLDILAALKGLSYFEEFFDSRKRTLKFWHPLSDSYRAKNVPNCYLIVKGNVLCAVPLKKNKFVPALTRPINKDIYREDKFGYVSIFINFF